MKRTILYFALMLAAVLPAKAQDLNYVTTPKDSVLAVDIMNSLSSQREEPIGDLVVKAGKSLLGQPYVAGTMDEAADETTAIYLTRTDCILFAETCLDMAEEVKTQEHPSFVDFASLVQKSRYRHGVARKYSDRLHYTSDWIRCNEARGLLRDVTLECGGISQDHPINYMSTHPESYPRMDASDRQVIEGVEESLNEAGFSYIPKAKIAAACSSMKPGDIICFVTTVKGLDISHVAIYVGKSRFMHASLAKKEVVIDDKSLADYAKSRSNVSGIKVVRPQVLPAVERELIWPAGKMPDSQDGQIAAKQSEAQAADFVAAEHRTAYLEWGPVPDESVRNGACMILIPGGSYEVCCDEWLLDTWQKVLTGNGIQCVKFIYRTPRPAGIPIYQTAWEDGQRAVRVVRSEAAMRGFDPDRIGTISMSAGSHLSLLLATSSLTAAYSRVDAIDDLPCNISWAIVNAPAYATTDGETGTMATRQGYGPDVKLSEVFKFDANTCPMSLHHGGVDPYTPYGSTLVYRKLRTMGVPAELHIYPDKGHGAYGLVRGIEFLRQMGFLGALDPEVPLMDRYPDDSARAQLIVEDVWPEGKMPDAQDQQCYPYIEWHIPAHLTTTAIQIMYSGGSYEGNDPNGFEVAPARRFLNDKGMAVVTLKYRTPRPVGLAKHTTAWEDLQRTIRMVKSEAASHGLDPERIGIMGCSAGGHLTLMGVTSSRHQAYLPIDDLDKIPCNVQWGIGFYPAYALTDGLEAPNSRGGNDDDAVLAPEFSFDLDTAPMLLLHGDSDDWAAMNSVKVWEKMASMGIQCELHTYAKRIHCFQNAASPGTGSYTCLDRIWEYLQPFIQ